MKTLYLTIYLLLISIANFANEYYTFNPKVEDFQDTIWQINTAMTTEGPIKTIYINPSRPCVKIFNNMRVNAIDENFLLKFDSIARVNNSRDTIYFNALKLFLEKDISQYRKDKIYEAKIKLYWPILALISIVLLVISIRRKEGPMQILALALLILSLLMTGVNLQSYLLLIKGSSLLYMIL